MGDTRRATQSRAMAPIPLKDKVRVQEIKIYLRKERVDDVVHELRAAGIAHMTVTHVQSLGSGVDPDEFGISFETGTQYTEKAKLEFVCPADVVDRLVSMIRSKARTGHEGDGMIFVAAIDRAVKISTGVEGPDALR